MADGAIVGFPQYIHFNDIKLCDLPVGTQITKNIVKEFGAGSFYSCVGFIDVNGISLPNEETDCSDGKDTENVDIPCTVKSRDIKDVYPVLFHNATVEPVTAARKYVLNTAK